MSCDSSSVNAEQSCLPQCEANCEAQGVHVTRTLALLCQAISEGVQAPEAVSSIADELLETDYRLPFGKGDFERWAAENLTMSP